MLICADAVRIAALAVPAVSGSTMGSSQWVGAGCAVQEVDIVVDGLGHAHHSALPTSAKCGIANKHAQHHTTHQMVSIGQLTHWLTMPAKHGHWCKAKQS